MLVGAGTRGELPALLGRFERVALVRDGAVRAPDIDAPELVLPGGEAVKSWARLREVVEFLEASGLRRDGCVVAVGGGTVGDLVGFAAAIWQRGIAHLQVPTTLLAMVDSALGGKTAIDTSQTKNAVGAFWQPAAVVADLDYLESLPQAQLRSGLAEVVKYAVAMDADLAGILDREPAVSESVIARCARLKGAVVAEDERELTGRRAVLNYGHTAGHAVEVASGYSVLHGEAVAFGMRVAARIGQRLGTCGPEVAGATDELLAKLEIPGDSPVRDVKALLAALPQDKKSAGGRVRWVLPREVGRAEPGWDVPDDLVRELLTEMVG